METDVTTATEVPLQGRAPDTQRPGLSREPDDPAVRPGVKCVVKARRSERRGGAQTDGRAHGHPRRGGQDAELQDRGEADPAAEGQRAGELTCGPARQPEGGPGGLGPVLPHLLGCSWVAGGLRVCPVAVGRACPSPRLTQLGPQGTAMFSATPTRRGPGPPPRTGRSLPPRCPRKFSH